MRTWPAAVAAALLAACSGGTPSFEPVPEPTSALRRPELRGRVPEEARIADYVLEARLDADAHTVAGRARVTWRNRTAHATERLPFHLYMNGFRAEDSAWMRSSRGRHRSSRQEEEGAWGFIDVTSVEQELAPGVATGGAEERGVAVRRELAWEEDDEPSTMTVWLPEPVEPGEEVTVVIDFLTQLPKVIARTGYLDDFHAVGQWYPKLGVLEEDGSWEAHSFTVHDEFFADFGDYTVFLDVPAEMVVGATGIRVAEEVADGRRRLTYEASMVHDFAWMADPNFVDVAAAHRGVRIRQLIQPERVGDAGEHLAAAVAALDSYEGRYGPYPWSTLTIVHPPEGAEGAGGMEYPTLFTTSDRAALPGWVRAWVLDERLSGLSTTVHELGHQYFQGLFASREHLEPWLDEGVNELSNLVALEDRYGESDPWVVRLLGQPIGSRDLMAVFLRRRAFLQPIDQPASAFDAAVGSYGATVYGKTAMALLTLRNLVGAPAFDEAFRRYCERARFAHPRGRDLEEVLVSALGPTLRLEVGDDDAELDVRSFLEQAFRTHHEVDFRLLSVANRRRLGNAGWHRDATGDLTGGEAPDNLDVELEDLPDEEVEGVVVVRRSGGFRVPVELLIELADGSSRRFLWDGEAPLAVYALPGSRVRRAALDPRRQLLLEWHRSDNVAFADELGDDGGWSRLVGDAAEAGLLGLLSAVGP